MLPLDKEKLAPQYTRQVLVFEGSAGSLSAIIVMENVNIDIVEKFQEWQALQHE